MKKYIFLPEWGQVYFTQKDTKIYIVKEQAVEGKFKMFQDILKYKQKQKKNRLFCEKFFIIYFCFIFLLFFSGNFKKLQYIIIEYEEKNGYFSNFLEIFHDNVINRQYKLQ